MPPDASAPLTLFVSYSHRDEALKDELIVHLANLKRQGKIAAWQDRDIEAGTEWDAEIKQQLESAEIILLLITPRFLASDYCYDLEMQRAVQRHNEGTARVIPIILKPCDWQGSPFSKLQVLPKDAKAVTQWPDQDEAFLNVVQGIRRAVESLHAKKHLGATPDSANAADVAPPQPLTPQFSTYNPATFTGREAETADLTQVLVGSCRILAIVGMTGIGKTALAERVIASLIETTDAATLPYIRFSLDDRSLTPDFSSSGAALLRTLGEEPTLADQQDPANLLAHLFRRLQSHPCRLQIDSLERLLRGNEQEGWSEFCDPLWLDLLHQFLAAADTRSQLLLTSQDIPADLDTVASRYPQFWHCEALQGLSAAEQLELFAKLGLPQDAAAQETLRQIGQFYDGHPLVLQVMAEEMRQPPFSENVARYWQHYAAEFAASSTAPAAAGNKLDRSRLFRRRVRQRVEQSIQRLPDPARQMLCASAVFRRPVPTEFWHAMLPDGDPYAAFDTLQDGHLVEYAPSEGDTLLIRQHNLIRAVAYALLKADPATWEAAERKAADLWLTNYEPAPNAERLETVRGYLEAFDHYCEVSDWEQASEIYTCQLVSTNQALHWQLLMWGYYKELIEVSRRLVNRIASQTKRLCLNRIGNSYSNLGNVERAIDYYQQALQFARETGDRQGEGRVLGDLGNAYDNLGEYEQAIDFHQQYLTIAREIGDRRSEGNALGDLGNAYSHLGQHERAIDFYQQSLSIAREISNRHGEGVALGNLGVAHRNLGQYERASNFHQQYLSIAREIGDRRGEGIALCHLGIAHHILGQYEQAIDLYQQYLSIAREIGDRQGEGSALGCLGIAHKSLGQYERAIDLYQQYLSIAREIGDRQGEGNALGNLGNAYDSLGQYERAIDFHQQSLSIAQEIGDRRGEGAALVNMGETQLKLEQYAESLTNNQAALEIFREIGDRANEAEALKNLAEVHQALGEGAVARHYGEQALALATELGIPLQAECEALLSELEKGDSE
ncbi:MAG: hypothetical protein Fur0046_30370 [Cyanobacteria bacterium J069]|nr:MAG: tetratricopeptide repeat protein [Cyanobacteria bacterium J069]